MLNLSLITPIASLIWLELINLISSGIGLSFAFLFTALFTAGIGYILYYLVKNKWVLFGIIEFLTIFFLIEHFTNGAYSVFMNPASIILGAGGVARDYMDQVIDIIKSGIGVILLMHIPAIAILVLNIIKSDWYKAGKLNKSNDPINRGIQIALILSPGILAILFGASFLKLTSPDAYTYAYSYDTSVRNFGLLQSVALDIDYGINGVPSNQEKVRKRREVAIKEPEIVEPEIVEPVEPPKPEKPDYKSIGYKGLFKGKNLIIICAESFSKELINETINPTIYKMAKEGIQIDDFYQPAWGGSTSTGEASILLGLVPTDGVKTIQKFSKKDNSFTIANKLKAEGYKTFAFHNGDYNYYNRNITHVALGYDQFIACGSGMQVDTSNWPKSDQEMMDFSVDMFKNEDPFCVYYMTISGHCRYNFGGNSMAKKHRNVMEALLPNSSERVQAYFACNYDLELGLESLLRQLKAAGKLDDTVIVMTGDHYPYAMEKGPTYDNDVNYLEELYGFDTDTVDKRDHNALIIWSPALAELDEPIHVTKTCYTPDILPTLLNLFGVEYDENDYAGTDMLSDSEGIAVWANGSWKTTEGFYNAGKGKFYGEADKEYIKEHKKMASDIIQKSRELIKK